MYEIIKSVIQSQVFELGGILRKIDIFWLKEQLTDVQRKELQDLAREKADPQLSVDLYEKVMELDRRVSALEPITPDNNYPEFQVGRIYYLDDRITFNSIKYRCIAPLGVACTWSPADYPNYWVEDTAVST